MLDMLLLLLMHVDMHIHLRMHMRTHMPMHMRMQAEAGRADALHRLNRQRSQGSPPPPPDEQAGGTFTTTDAISGKVTAHACLGRGDAILFDSELVHGVTTLSRGTRQSLVIELWTRRENRKDRFC